MMIMSYNKDEKDVIFLNMFTKRQKELLLGISNGTGKIKGSVLASQLHISLRTLQSEVRNINQGRNQPLILSDRQGYFFNTNVELPQKLIQEQEVSSVNDVLRKLMLQGEHFDIDELADACYISNTTLQQRLKEVEQILHNYHLYLRKEKHHVWVEGTELDQRRMIRHLIYEDAQPIFIDLETCAKMLPDMDILRIRDIILQAIHHYNCYVEDAYANNLMINITIALYRMRSGFPIDPDDESKAIVDEHFIEYKIAQEICDHYANHWSLPFSKQEVHYIAMLIMGQIKPELLHKQIGQRGCVIDKHFQEQVKELLLKTFNYYMLSIDCDTFLYNFVLHVDALIKRATSHQQASNAIVENIKLTCPFIYDVSVFLAKEIEDTFHIQITDEEIGFISIHIGFVIENSTKDSDKIKVLLVCNEYHHILDNILNKLKENYSQTIEIVNIITNFTQNKLESSVDLIISTLPIKLIGKKVVTISPFYTMMDHLNVDQAINACIQEQRTRKDQQLLLTYFHEKLFFKRTDLDNKEAVIRFLGQKIIDFGLAKDGFIESVWKREQMSSTCFFETFAIPHAIELNANKTMFCVLVNPKGIKWDNHMIHLVFMITVQRNDRKAFMKIYNGIIQTLCQKEKASALVEADTLMEFIECFKR